MLPDKQYIRFEEFLIDSCFKRISSIERSLGLLYLDRAAIWVQTIIKNVGIILVVCNCNCIVKRDHDHLWFD